MVIKLLYINDSSTVNYMFLKKNNCVSFTQTALCLKNDYNTAHNAVPDSPTVVLILHDTVVSFIFCC